MKIGIVGGGLFGKIIGLHLGSLGHRITIYDDGRPESGFAAAGCLVKPSWIAKVPRRQEALEVLDRVAGLREEHFTMLGYKMPRTDPVFVLNKQALSDNSWEKVEFVSRTVVGSHGSTLRVEDQISEFDHLIRCTGSWSPYSTPKFGVSFEIHGVQTTPAIRPWRPFTQLVRYNMTPTKIWAGDGTALKQWSEESTKACEARVLKFVQPGEDAVVERIVGRRPYPIANIDGPCGIHHGRVKTHVFGGGKNGSIAAGWAALEIAEALDGR